MATPPSNAVCDVLKAAFSGSTKIRGSQIGCLFYFGQVAVLVAVGQK
jgi:hypothetical protein